MLGAVISILRIPDELVFIDNKNLYMNREVIALHAILDVQAQGKKLLVLSQTKNKSSVQPLVKDCDQVVALIREMLHAFHQKNQPADFGIPQPQPSMYNENTEIHSSPLPPTEISSEKTFETAINDNISEE